MTSSNGNIFRVTGNWVNNREAGALKHHRPYYEVTVMKMSVVCNVGQVLYSKWSNEYTTDYRQAV